MEHQEDKRRKMKNVTENIFSYLPPEIVTEILIKLPAQTILTCKSVCKSWRDLFETHDFAKSHHSKSLPGIALVVKSDENDKITDDLHVNTITKLSFTHYKLQIHGSVDGFLLLVKYERLKCKLYLCNPITREYIDLLHSNSQSFDTIKQGYTIYGFGVSKITGQYKVVGIFYGPYQEPVECKVYTIGTGSWRSIAPHAEVRYKKPYRGEFMNGNLHWLVDDLYGKLWISCFDVETEIFSAFSPPPEKENSRCMRINVVEDTLCVCVYTCRYADQIIIWLMKEYGDENSWTRQFIIGRNIDIWNDSGVYPIRFSKDGVILLSDGNSVYYYSNQGNKTTRIKTICNFQGCEHKLHSYTQSFLSLKCFKMENVLSLGLFRVNQYLDC